jgi:hypothetical protein
LKKNNFCLSIRLGFMLYRILIEVGGASRQAGLEERAKALEVRGACPFGALEGAESLFVNRYSLFAKPYKINEQEDSSLANNE